MYNNPACWGQRLYNFSEPRRTSRMGTRRRLNKKIWTKIGEVKIVAFFGQIESHQGFNRSSTTSRKVVSVMGHSGKGGQSGQGGRYGGSHGGSAQGGGKSGGHGPGGGNQAGSKSGGGKKK